MFPYKLTIHSLCYETGLLEYNPIQSVILRPTLFRIKFEIETILIFYSSFKKRFIMLKQATFRFYEELNDFFSANKRKEEFIRKFEGNPSVKDIIEAIGVPHVEIDLIMVNGVSVDFKYILQNDDKVSVYPVFETLNIEGVTHLRSKPLRETKFILDVHLGKLAKYLRMLGFDSLYRKDNDDPEIIGISLAEHRIILTRDIGLLKIKTVTHAYFLRSQDPKEQIEEVLKYFDLYHSVDPFNRCIKCNGQLEPVEKEKIITQLEPLTIRYFNTFYICKNCKSIFWEGTHYEHMLEFMRKIKNSVDK